MLAELILSAITRAPWRWRRLGMVTESVGLWSRSFRRRRQWQPHYEQCKALVRTAMADLPSRRSVLVLGSGLARDIPLEELSRQFERVLLVDVVHLPLTRLRLRRHRNLVYLTRDLSGAVDFLLGKAAAPSDPLAEFIADEAIDFVISANLLSQLPIPLENWLEDHPARAKALPADLPAQVVRAHLAGLARFRAPVCLITDIEMRGLDRSGATVDTLDLMLGEKLPEPDAHWDWTVAPFGEINPAFEYVHRVQGYRRYRPAR